MIMNIFVWFLQVALALFFFFPALMKLTTSKEKLVEQKKMPPNGSISFIRILGTMEILGSIGMILPIWLNTYPVLTPLAAVGFCIVMTGALVFHFKKKEYKMLPLLSLVFVLSATVALYHFSF
jgi:hypothetical protein